MPVETFHDDFKLEAMVVRRTKSGVGLMFLEMSAGVRRAFQSALYGTPSFMPA